MKNLDAITTQLRRDYKHNLTRRDKTLLAIVVILIAIMFTIG